jgi:hypothetical protein
MAFGNTITAATVEASQKNRCMSNGLLGMRYEREDRQVRRGRLSSSISYCSRPYSLACVEPEMDSGRSGSDPMDEEGRLCDGIVRLTLKSRRLKTGK